MPPAAPTPAVIQQRMLAPLNPAPLAVAGAALAGAVLPLAIAVIHFDARILNQPWTELVAVLLVAVVAGAMFGFKLAAAIACCVALLAAVLHWFVFTRPLGPRLATTIAGWTGLLAALLIQLPLDGAVNLRLLATVPVAVLTSQGAAAWLIARSLRRHAERVGSSTDSPRNELRFTMCQLLRLTTLAAIAAALASAAGFTPFAYALGAYAAALQIPMLLWMGPRPIYRSRVHAAATNSKRADGMATIAPQFAPPQPAERSR